MGKGIWKSMPKLCLSLNDPLTTVFFQIFFKASGSQKIKAGNNYLVAAPIVGVPSIQSKEMSSANKNQDSKVYCNLSLNRLISLSLLD